ncbi:MAG TPA: pantoate--beta-alanine ligase [Solirubrobacteraceae bacterium]
MRTLRTIAHVRSVLAGHRQAGEVIGLVPTMGGLHDGHLSLFRQARRACDVVVASLFVNPTQFEDPRDLEAYPRDEEQDARQAAEQGVDYLFVPALEELYPEGFVTTVSVAGVTETLEGAIRGRAHFDGVATVVAKLFNIVLPDVAYFGQKDAQQAVVIRRMVEDLAYPIRIELGPIVRESDGLAMSSRNVRLSGDERRRASALYQALIGVQRTVDGGESDAAAVRAQALAELSSAGITPEYLELVSADSLAPVATVDDHALAVVAARVGGTRLIDNLIIQRSPENGRP